MKFNEPIDIYITPNHEIFSGVNRFGKYFLNANNMKDNKHKTFNQNRVGFIQAMEFLGFTDKATQTQYLKGKNEIYEWELR